MSVIDIIASLLVLTTLRYSLVELKREATARLIRDHGFQHLTFASIFIIYLLWSVKAGIKDHLDIHFLGLTTLTMMYGWRFSHLMAVLVALLLLITGSIQLTTLPMILLITCTLPILCSYSVFALSYHYLPRNIFVFIFIAGFFNSALNAVIHFVLTSGYLGINGQYDWITLYDNYLALTPLIAFPEGLLNGMALALMVVFKPEWVRVFSDRAYLYHPHHK